MWKNVIRKHPVGEPIIIWLRGHFSQSKVCMKRKEKAERERIFQSFSNLIEALNPYKTSIFYHHVS
jgi:hypothetical protein